MGSSEIFLRLCCCSVGAHVRDAAAYVCWAFARAYEKEAMAEAARQLAPALLAVACYDREVPSLIWHPLGIS